MAAPRSLFVCRRCEYQSPKWLGRCPECADWGSLEEERPTQPRSRRPSGVPVQPLAEIRASEFGRMGTGLEEFDAVLGGGLLAGMAVLVGGEPGIGKSTLLLQAAGAMARAGRDVLYASGEESASQLKLRADRLDVSDERIGVLTETDADAIVEAAGRERPAVLLVDSVQTLRCADVAGVPGSISQVRESSNRLVEYAKSTGTPLILVGHVTKEGALAGPRALEHLVDTVIQFEGDAHHAHRILRTSKNRFGPADELGVFRMTDRGLEGVRGASELFLAEKPRGCAGSTVLAAMSGTRPVLVEVQALIGGPAAGSPRRTSIGVDGSRTALILAILQRRLGVDIADRDVFVNVTGGLTISEPAADLAVAIAVVSAFHQAPVPDGWVVFGELGLTGEVRSVARSDARLREAARMGFSHAVAPAAVTEHPRALSLAPVGRVRDAVAEIFGAQIG